MRRVRGLLGRDGGDSGMIVDAHAHVFSANLRHFPLAPNPP